MRLVKIPKNIYEDYKLSVMFDGYKWDPQFLDNNTVANHALVLTYNEHQKLKKYVEKLGQETEQAEQFINHFPHKVKNLKLPYKMKVETKRLRNYDPEKHIRLMRFDFHPLVDGSWAISEVNSDVPGGFAEASLMPEIALKYLKNDELFSINFSDVLVDALIKKIRPQGRIMLIHCTSYSDDRQVMQFIGDKLEHLGFEIIYGAADHLKFIDQKAYCILENNEGFVDGIIRFNPIEWVVDIKPKKWEGYFDTLTPSCNHPVAVLTQSKRFPLIWDILEKEGLDLSAWRKLLPETHAAKRGKSEPGFIYKPVWGRVGEGISIKESIKIKEYKDILKDVRKRPRRYISQKQFISKPLLDTNKQEHHLSLGVYYVEGNFAGYYARISKTARIDSNAQDIPVLIERENYD